MKFSKENWKLSKYENWLECNIYSVESLISDEAIVRLLINGVPNQFAPFSSFNSNEKYIEFKTLNNYFDENFEDGNSLIVFGTNGSGNPFCFNKSSNNQIILFDIDTENKIFVNENFGEFLDYILEYRDFIFNIQEKYGENALLDCLYKTDDMENLRERMQKISGKLSLSEFWQEEIRLLILNKDI